MKRKYMMLLAGLCLCCAVNLQAQKIINWAYAADAITPSGRTSAILKSVETAAGLSHGIYTVSVPIHNIQSAGIPIALTYQATGLRVNERTSSVGTGWHLEAGGVIARVIRDKYDETHSVGYIDLPSTDKNRINKALVDYTNSDLEPLSTLSTSKDTEPDVFYYKFGKYTGKFILGPETATDEGEAILLNKGNIKITYKISSNKIISFHAYTADGMEYWFEAAMETATISSTTYNTAWYLSSILSQSATVCSFEYTNSTITEKHLINQGAYYPSSTGSEINMSAQWKTVTYAVPQVTAIRWSRGIVAFGYDTESKLLKDITISDAVDNKRYEKKYFLTYSEYASSGTAANAETSSPNKRWKLDSFYEAQGKNLLTHEFTYNTSALPPINGYEQDYWGFYNDSDEASSFIPALWVYEDGYELFERPLPGSLEFTIAGADRAANQTAVQAGVLLKVRNPLGGVTEMAFESNRFVHNTQLEYGGGLRIASVKKYDEETPAKYTQTDYAYHEWGSPTAYTGRPIQIPQFAQKTTPDFFHTGLNTQEMHKRATFRFGVPTGTSQGLFTPCVFYHQVITTNDQGSVVKKYAYPFDYADWLNNPGTLTHLFPATVYSKSLYQQETGIPDTEINFYTDMAYQGYGDPVNPTYDWNTIYLTEEAIYKPSGGIVKKTVYEYNTPDYLDSVAAMARGPLANMEDYDPPTNTDIYGYQKTFQRYLYYSAWKLPKKKTETIYDGNGNSFDITEEYAYDDYTYRNLNKITYTDQFGEKSSTIRKYLTHAHYDFSAVEDQALDAIANAAEDRRNDQQTEGIFTFDDRPPYYGPRSSREAYHTVIHAINISNDIKVLKMAQEEFQYGLLIEEYQTVGTGADEMVVSGTYTHYQMLKTILAPDSVYALKKMIPLTSFTTSQLIDDNNAFYIKKEESYVPVKYDMVYNPQEDLAEYKGEDGVRIATHAVDGIQLLEAVNAPYTSLSGFESGDDITTLQAGKPNAMITMKNTHPLLGVVQETDARGRTTYYEHDKYGNLQTIKDTEQHILEARRGYTKEATDLYQYDASQQASASFQTSSSGYTKEPKSIQKNNYNDYYTYTIDFGDGSSGVFTSADIYHAYAFADDYTVTVKAWLNNTLLDQESKVITIQRSTLTVAETLTGYTPPQNPVLENILIDQYYEGELLLTPGGGEGTYTVKLRYYYDQNLMYHYPDVTNTEIPLTDYGNGFYFLFENKGYYANIEVEVTDGADYTITKQIYSGKDYSTPPYENYGIIVE